MCCQYTLDSGELCSRYGNYRCGQERFCLQHLHERVDRLTPARISEASNLATRETLGHARKAIEELEAALGDSPCARKVKHTRGARWALRDALEACSDLDMARRFPKL